MARPRRRSLGALFLFLAAGFAGLTAYAAADRAWIIAVGAGAISIWLGELAFRSLR